MNSSFAKILMFAFFWGVGAYQILKGITDTRARLESTFWGWVRIVLGALLVLAPLPLIYLLYSGTGE